MENQKLFDQLKQKSRTLDEVIVRSEGKDKSTIRKLYTEIKELLGSLKNESSSQKLYKALGACALLFLPFFNQQAKGQSFTVDSTAFNLPNGYYMAIMAIADMDADGDLDIFYGEYYGDVKFFENVGDAQNPLFSVPLVNPFGLTTGNNDVSVPFLGDIDDDGDMDMFVANELNQIEFFENTGTASSPQFASSVTNPFNLGGTYPSYVPQFADIDNDGDLDIFYGDFTYTISFQENIGTPSNPNFSAAVVNPFNISVPNSYYNALDLADIDHDGDLDIMAGGLYEFKFIENVGSASNPDFASTVYNPFGLDSCYYIVSFSFADMDNDGDQDFFVSNYYLGDIIYYENQEVSGVQEREKSKISMYPNPAQDQLYVEHHENVEQLSILDATGKRVFQSNPHQQNVSVDVSGLRKGVYFVEINTGEEVYHQQFVKE